MQRKDIILKPSEAIWFLHGYLPLILALPCEGEKSVQKAAVSLLLPTHSKLGLNSLTGTNKTDISNYFRSVFVQYADNAKALDGLADTNFAVPRHRASRVEPLKEALQSAEGDGASLRWLLDCGIFDWSMCSRCHRN